MWEHLSGLSGSNLERDRAGSKHLVCGIQQRLALVVITALRIQSRWRYESAKRCRYESNGNSSHVQVNSVESTSLLLAGHAQAKSRDSLATFPQLGQSQRCILQNWLDLFCIFFKILKRDENGEWRKFHNDELYSSPNIVRVIQSRRVRWAGHVARMEEGRNALKILTGAPAGKRPLGRRRRRWEHNIRMYLK